MRDDDEDGTPDGGPVRVPVAPVTAATPQTGPHSDVDFDQERKDDSATSRPVSSDMQQFIGRQLRAVFDDVARQPVPDRFLELMKQLDSKTGVR